MLGPLRVSSVRKDIVPHGFHKLAEAFSSISPSQYRYFDVGMLFYHSALLNIMFILYHILYILLYFIYLIN
jgi:hypothetical protein